MTARRTPAQDWSAVAAAWDANAEYVDDHTSVLTEALVEALEVRPGDRLLELAAGPGTLGGRWSGLVGPAGWVVLSDLAPGMVDAARRRNERLANVEVAVLDASRIDRADASFGVVACRMGLMFTPDPAVAFGEIRRVLGDGGRFAALTWASVEHNPWITCVGMAAAMHGVTGGEPPVGPGTIFSLGDAGELATLVRSTFGDVVVREVPTTFHAPSIEAHIERVTSLAGPLSAAFAAATPEQLAAVRQTAAELAAGYVDEAGVHLPGRALLAAARV